MSNNEVKSVFGIIFSEDRSNVLLIKRRDVPVWVLPGGGIEQNETEEEAIVREIKEETNLSCSIIRKVATYMPPRRGLFLKPTSLFECKTNEKTFAINAEVREIAFFPITDLPKRIPPPFKEFISDASEKMPPITKTVQTVTFWNIVRHFSAHPVLAFRFIVSRFGFHINT